MIVRLLRIRVRPSKVGAFNAVFRAQVALLREQPGLVYVKLARRLQADGAEEVVLFEEWRDAASLYEWVGADLTEPRLVPGSRELVEEIVVAHYEALDKDTDEAASTLTHAHPTDEHPTDEHPQGEGAAAAAPEMRAPD